MNKMDYKPYLQWIDSQYSRMCGLVESWGNINSGSANLEGLEWMLRELQTEFQKLDGKDEVLVLPSYQTINSSGNFVARPLGKALSIRKRPHAGIQMFLCGHMDTVFSKDSPFQTVTYKEDNILQGPGICDMKGGLVVMLTALEALERTPIAEHIGWEVLITPDEEIGSPGSRFHIERAAKRHHLGFIFEPTLPNGSFVSARKGSANFTIISRGKAAHAGREPHLGRNAIVGLASLILEINEWNQPEKGIIVNIGIVEGGRTTNIIPDLAICHLNIRVDTQKQSEEIHEAFHQLIEKRNNGPSGIVFTLHAQSDRPPKSFDAKTQKIFEAVAQCGKELGLLLSWEPGGGVTDGNILASCGLPNIDTLGVRGDHIHTYEENIALNSLPERAKLSALLFMKCANNEILQEICHEPLIS